MNKKINGIKSILILFILFLCAVNVNAEKKKFGFDDAMKFKGLRSASISEDGNWIAYYLNMERGDPTGVVQSVTVDSIKYEVERGTRPIISTNGEWVAMTLAPKAVDMANAKPGKAPKQGMALLRTSDGKEFDFDEIQRFQFSNDAKWIAYHSFNGKGQADKKKKKLELGTDLTIRHLSSEAEVTFRNVTEFQFDSLSNYFSYVVSEPEGKKNGIYYIDLQSAFLFPIMAVGEEKAHYTEMAWNHDKGLMAYISALEKDNGAPDSCSINIWSPKTKEIDTIITPETDPEDWFIPFKNKLEWTTGGERLYFGFKPYLDTLEEDEDEITYTDSTFYDKSTILKKTQLDVWHWNDPLIKPNRKVYWPRIKDRIFHSVYHLDRKEYVQLADLDCPDVIRADNPQFVIGTNDEPYLKEITWDGWFKDLYVIDIRTGEKKLVRKRQEHSMSLSPNGYYLTYFYKKHWYLYDCNAGTERNLTNVPTLKEIPFYDEKWDTPAEPADLGVSCWFENDDAVMVNGNYDLYLFSTRDSSWFNQTAGYGDQWKIQFRVKNLDPDKKFFTITEPIYLQGYHDLLKKRGLFKLTRNVIGYEEIAFDDRYYSLHKKAKNAEKYLVIRQRYNEYPDIWVADSAVTNMRKVTDIYPEMKDYYWGDTKLISWKSDDGDSLQGYVILPEDYDSTKRYPVVIYFYEKMTQRMHRFEEPGNHHRPCFQVYNSDGYVIFLPDVNFTDGRPGYASVNSVLPGAKKLVELGIADSNKIGLWGHSWSGYQAAFIITQTDYFACAVGGAPVGNMTSAYSGIRLGSGLARQFQYEKQQSRIGGNLWDSLDNYIKNSPIFMAQGIKTPLLIMFGDKDQAVPWEQGIELYLAMRRLNKNCIFLEYRGEPHWPMKYYNRLDYAIKMKEFYDHYLKGAPAPDWMTKGVEFKGK